MKTIFTKGQAQVSKPNGFQQDVIDIFNDDPTVDTKRYIAKMKTLEAYETSLLDEIDFPVGYGEPYEVDGTDATNQVLNAINNREKIIISYRTLYGNVRITRTITPYYIYDSESTGNTIVVTWCDEWDDYRAFALSNIDNVNKIGGETLLEGQNKMSKKFNRKKAHKVGVQGYALMNDRAFCNCQKVKMEKTNSHWKAWSDCWAEYKDAYNKDPDKWLEKYVPVNPDVLKTSVAMKEKISNYLIKDVEEAVGASRFVGASIRNTLLKYSTEEIKESG